MEFEQYFLERRVALFRFAVVLTGDEVLADDLLAEVLRIAFEQWPRVSAADHVHAYVRRMIVNEFLTWRSRTARIVVRSDFDALVDRTRHVADHADVHATQQELVMELDRLPPKQRAAIVLRYYEGLNDAEIAEVMGTRRTAVRSNISRGLSRLRVRFADGANDHERLDVDSRRGTR